MSKLSFRNRQGDLVDIPSIPATQLKNEFGIVLERVMLGGAVAITKHQSPKAILISFAEFETLINAGATNLDSLNAQFDEFLARMQTNKAKKGMRSAFDASPVQLGRNAVKARSRKR